MSYMPISCDICKYGEPSGEGTFYCHNPRFNRAAHANYAVKACDMGMIKDFKVSVEPYKENLPIPKYHYADLVEVRLRNVLGDTYNIQAQIWGIQYIPGDTGVIYFIRFKANNVVRDTTVLESEILCQLNEDRNTEYFSSES